MPLNPEQTIAVEAMLDFLDFSGKNLFLLSGYAGTGKTFTMKHLIKAAKGRFIFTAPTNKATKVLRETLTSDQYKPECRTIYSLLGLRLEANGEVKELTTPEDPVDLSQYRAVIVDEASMVNSNLFEFIQNTALEQDVKFIFLGDSAQLPPVGERHSPVWDAAEVKAELTQVMRYDNQLLVLATALRDKQQHPAPSVDFKRYHAPEKGVDYYQTSKGFLGKIMLYTDLGDFVKPDAAKVVAWRNVTVNVYNKLIRERIFPEAASSPWLVGDRVIMTAPAKNLDGQPMASTDDEGTVTRVAVDWHPIWQGFKVWRLSVTFDDNRLASLIVLHETSYSDYDAKTEELSAAARADRRKWKTFWEFKEDFHSVRYSYAITTHRAQGSTYKSVFVCANDILLNRNRLEAFQCLYVACTRASDEVFIL